AFYDLVRAPFPPVVRIETTNACNARCTICPHERMRRPTQRMDDRLFAAIIRECGQHRCREVHLHNFGEPLLDKRLESMVAMAKKAGVRRVKIFTNGSLLSHDRAKGLIAAGLDEIKISFDGASAAEFERIRQPLRFEQVVANIHELVALRNAAGSPLRIAATCCSTSDKGATMAALERIVDRFHFDRIHNWSGEQGRPVNQGIRKPCSRLWRTLTILADGQVSLCCLDYDGQVRLGQVSVADGANAGQGIAAIWRSGAFSPVRRCHARARQDEMPLCAGCSKSFL
ncbi:MAG: radical SAM protein, partial [Magnetococcales bacterium]|nr:radical SAM protein [Magnetococcales bacterium]